MSSSGMALRKTKLVELALLLVALCSSAYGQATATTAQGITGVVEDPSGAAVPSATVVARNVETGVETKTTSTQAGYFSFPGLVIGTYTITVSKEGFRTFVRENVTVLTGQTPNVAARLELGKTTETVTVTAEGPLDTTTTTTGDTVPQAQIASLPVLMNGGTRSPVNYLTLFAGVSPNTFGGRGGGFLGISNINGIGDGGGFSNVTGYRVDGLYMSTDQSQSLAANFPAPQNIQEVRLLTNTNSDQGFDMGSTFEIVTKSGTNSYHGEVYEYIRNEALDARNWFAAKRPPEKQNDFGFTFGGPIRKDKHFFFVNYVGFRQNFSSQTLLLTVPTPKMRAGDFTEVLGPQLGTDQLGRPVYQGQIFDPLTTRPDGRVGFIRDPFPGNVIPQNRFSRISTFFQNGYPLPNRPGTNLNWVGPELAQQGRQDKLYIKTDHQFTPRHRLSVGLEYFIRAGSPKCANALGVVYEGWGEDVSPCFTTQGNSRYLRLNYTFSVRPNFLLAVHFGAAYTPATLLPGDKALTAGSRAGIKGTYTGGIPILNFGSAITGLQQLQNRVIQTFGTFPATVDGTWVKGSHQIKFGTDFAVNFRLNHSEAYSNGSFTFDGGGTNQLGFLGGGPGRQPGHSWADFLLGWVDAAQVQSPFAQRTGSQQWGWYVMDQWRLTPRLSINYGLRWELFLPSREQYDRMANFCPTCPNSEAGGRLGALTFSGKGPGRNGRTRAMDVYPWALGPRLGVAYEIFPGTVLRGYYGMHRYPINVVQWGGINFPNFGWGATLSPATQNGGITPVFANWDQGTFTLPSLPNLDPTFLTGSGVPYWNPKDNRPALAHNLGFQVLHQFSNGMVVSAKYAGKMVRGLPTNNLVNLNQLPLTYLPLGTLLLQNINSQAAQDAGIPLPYPGFQGSVLQALRPFPQYQTIVDIQSMVKNTDWHAGILSLQQTWRNGLSLLANYTFSKLLTNDPWFIGGFGAGNNYWIGAVQHTDLRDKTGRGFPMSFISGIGGDRPQVLNISYTYELPFGRDKRFLKNLHPFVDAVLGGWTVSGIQNYASGTPIWITSTQGLPTLSIWSVRVPGESIRGNATCSSYDPGDPNSHYLNVNAFANPARFQLGDTAQLPSDRTCGIIQESFALFKSFKIQERFQIKLGADFINAFNRHSFYGLQSVTAIPQLMGRFTAATDARAIQLHAQVMF